MQTLNVLARSITVENNNPFLPTLKCPVLRV
jgi:hypothetical protein